MSYKVEIKVFGDPDFYPSGLTFATAEEANGYGTDKVLVWIRAEKYRVVESDQTPNYSYDPDNGLVPLSQPTGE